MSTLLHTDQHQPALSRAQFWLRIVLVLLLLFIFLCGIRGMGTGFKGLGKDLLHSFFQATENPFISLVIGILGTTLVQSSSVTTSMIVAMVAAPGSPLPIPNAVPMIMGANIGTTVTNTMVALGHINRPDEFRRAFAAATCHDFFNFMTVAILLPLEIATGFLATASGHVAEALGTGGGGKMPNPIKQSTKAVVTPVKEMLADMMPSQTVASTALIVLSVVVIFIVLTYLVKTLRLLAATRAQVYLSRSLDASPYISLLIGVVVTVMVQSSSITTSVMVPLAGAGIVTLAQVFPVTLGANIGTTVTAILASMAAPAETASLAVQIAVVHLMFNVLGIGMFFPFETIRRIPLRAAEWLASVAVRSRQTAIWYVIVLFYIVPGGLVMISKLF